MNSKLLSAFSAIAFAVVAVAPSSFAKVYSPSQFNAELKKKVGAKKGLKATNAAASLLKSALGDKKNSKNAAKYASSIVKILKKPVPPTLQGSSTNTLVRALLEGYFKGVKTFSLNNPGYNSALTAFLSKLPGSEKAKPTISQSIYDTIKNYASKKPGYSQQAVYDYYSGVATKNKLISPPPVS